MEASHWIALLIPMALAVGLSVAPWTRTHIVSPYITVIHEYGHVVANILTLSRPRGIKARFGNGGGETHSERPPGFFHGIGALVSGLAGYPAPILFGLMLIFSVSGGWVSYLLNVCSVVFIIFVLLMRNLSGILLALTTAAYFFFAASQAIHMDMMALAAGAVILVGGVVDMVVLVTYWAKGISGETDLGILQRRFLLPKWFWLAAMLVGTGFGAYGLYLTA